MKIKLFIRILGICVITLVTVFIPVSLFAETGINDNTVIADGIAAIIDNKIEVAEKEALRDAQRVAVEKVIGVMIYAGSLAKNFELVNDCIGASTSGYVDTYKILNRGRDSKDNDLYKIRIKATVSRGKLHDNYRGWLQSLGNPMFFVESFGDLELKETFINFFMDLGFKITTDLGKAAYVIELNGNFISTVHPLEKIEGIQLGLWVKMIDIINREIIFNLKNNPKKSTAFGGSKAQQHDITIRKAFKQLQKPLQEKIKASLENWTRYQCK